MVDHGLDTKARPYEEAQPDGRQTAATNLYRVYIRLPGLRPITKSSTTRKLAETYARHIEGDHEAAKALGQYVIHPALLTTADLIERYDEQ